MTATTATQLTTDAVPKRTAVPAAELDSSSKRMAVEEASHVLRVKLLSDKGRLPVRGSPLAAGYDLFRFVSLTLIFNAFFW